jgi:hypothetical protein
MILLKYTNKIKKMLYLNGKALIKMMHFVIMLVSFWVNLVWILKTLILIFSKIEIKTRKTLFMMHLLINLVSIRLMKLKKY